MRGVQAFDESRTDVSSSSRFSGERRGRGWPWQLASCSRGVKCDVDELRRGFTMLEALGDDAEGERLDASDSLVPVLTVGHDTRQRRHFGQPTAVVLSLNFNRERHSGNVPSGPAV